MRRELYVCEYPYILYKVLIHAIQNPDIERDLIITDASQRLSPLCNEIRKSGLFRKVWFFDSTPYADYYQLLYCQYPNETLKKYLFVLKNYIKMSLYQKKFKNMFFLFDIDFRTYDKIYCSDHQYVINGYLAQNRIPFSLIEHARNVYQYVKGPYNLFYYVLEKLEWTRVFGALRCTSKYCTEIVVNENKSMPSCTRRKKITEWNVENAIERLSSEQKECIFQLYANAYDLSIDYSQDYNLLLTNPLLNDGFVPSEENQVHFYKDLIAKHFSAEYPMLIKPHPRDTLNYRKYFSSAQVVSPEIASEILRFSSRLKIEKVLTLYSTSAESFRQEAKEIVCLYPNTSLPEEMEILENYQ